MAESAIISIDYSNGKDNTVLIVGKKRPNQVIEVVNAFQGEEAIELWEKLTIKKEKKND
ncbi:MAG: hypothetical protein IKY27_00295 [Bacteroidales bacterium]|nr:hypothetical protein [Bacteroidales bacterium]